MHCRPRADGSVSFLSEAMPISPFSVRFAIPGYEKRFHYEVAWKWHRQVPQQAALYVAVERLRLGNDVIFARSDSQWDAWPDARPKPKLESKLYISSFPTVSEAVLAFTALTSGIGWHDFPADVFRP